jgi:hypothetical protein
VKCQDKFNTHSISIHYWWAQQKCRSFKNTLLSLLIYTKLQDWTASDVSHKCDQSSKLIIDNDDVNAEQLYKSQERFRYI